MLYHYDMYKKMHTGAVPIEPFPASPLPVFDFLARTQRTPRSAIEPRLARRHSLSFLEDSLDTRTVSPLSQGNARGLLDYQ